MSKREIFEGLLWRLSQVSEDVRSNAPEDLTADEVIELLVVARKVEDIVFHRPAVTEPLKATTSASVRGERAA